MRTQQAKQKIKHQFREFVAMFLYLWVIFGLFALHESILRAEAHQNYPLQGFAVINALILAKVMLVAEDLKLAHGGAGTKPISVILKKSTAFAVLFICFHVIETVVVGVWRGNSVAASFPQLAGGSLQGIISLGVIMSVCLIPFFAFRELDRKLGPGRMVELLTTPHARDD